MYEHTMHQFNLYITDEKIVPILVDNLITLYHVKSVQTTPVKYSRKVFGETALDKAVIEIRFICEPLYTQSIIDYAESLKTDVISKNKILDYCCTKLEVISKENYFISDMSKLLANNAELRVFDNEKAVIYSNGFPTDCEGQYNDVDEIIRKWNRRNDL